MGECQSPNEHTSNDGWIIISSSLSTTQNICKRTFRDDDYTFRLTVHINSNEKADKWKGEKVASSRRRPLKHKLVFGSPLTIKTRDVTDRF